MISRSRHTRGDIVGAASSAVLASFVFLVLLLAIGGAHTADRVAGATGAARTHRAIEVRTATAPDGIPILSYHYLRRRTGLLRFARILGALAFNLPLLDDMGIWTQTTAEFDRELRYLHDAGYETVDLEDLAAWRRGLRKLPPKPVVITFDDGDRSVLLAVPILKRYGFKATLFIVTGRVGSRWQGVDALRWDEIAALEETGVFSIQSHTHDLHDKVKTAEGTLPVFIAASLGLYDFPGGRTWSDVLLDDLRASRRAIESRLGRDARFLAWPYGVGSDTIDSVAVAAGFEGVCTLRYGVNAPLDAGAPPAELSSVRRSGANGRKIDWDRWELKRYTMTARTSLRRFKKMMSGKTPLPETSIDPES